MTRVVVALTFLFSHLVLLTGLSYSPALHRWQFDGRVEDVREVFIFGYPAEVARVNAGLFEAWVVTHMDDVQLALGSISVGDKVQVSISGSHVFSDRVDWDKCKPSSSDYCRWGALVDSGPISLDTGLPLSPSNELIQYGEPNPYWWEPGGALFWNLDVLAIPDPSSNLVWPFSFPSLQLRKIYL